MMEVERPLACYSCSALQARFVGVGARDASSVVEGLSLPVCFFVIVQCGIGDIHAKRVEMST